MIGGVVHLAGVFIVIVLLLLVHLAGVFIVILLLLLVHLAGVFQLSPLLQTSVAIPSLNLTRY